MLSSPSPDPYPLQSWSLTLVCFVSLPAGGEHQAPQMAPLKFSLDKIWVNHHLSPPHHPPPPSPRPPPPSSRPHAHSPLSCTQGGARLRKQQQLTPKHSSSKILSDSQQPTFFPYPQSRRRSFEHYSPGFQMFSFKICILILFIVFYASLETPI